jgi:hypothetical protein
MSNLAYSEFMKHYVVIGRVAKAPSGWVDAASTLFGWPHQPSCLAKLMQEAPGV